jgi:ribonuclease E
LKHDRARIQVGRISHFGLLEMSRQRLRQGMLEGSTRPCPHCEGTGLVRSVSSSALSVLRGVEEQLMSRKAENLTVYCHPEVANYILNDKRDHVLSLENGHGVSIFIVPRERVRPWESEIERGVERPGLVRRAAAQEPAAADLEDEEAEGEVIAPAKAPAEAPEESVVALSESGPGEEQPRRRRRRGRRGGRRSKDRADMTPAERQAADQADEREADDREALVAQPAEPQRPEPVTTEPAAQPAAEAEAEAAVASEPSAKPKRAKRARRAKPAATEAAARSETEADAAEVGRTESGQVATGEPAGVAPDGPTPKPKRPARKAAVRKRKAAPKAAPETPPKIAASEPAGSGGNGADRVTPASHERQVSEPAPQAGGEARPEDRPTEEQPKRWQPPEPTAKPSGPPRTGWWRR